ncbi:MAG: CotH kinase family protein [Alphaproteobacteria bacterium]|nr:CotH kinase family protein [Alphaproteobacteria bacterium]
MTLLLLLTGCGNAVSLKLDDTAPATADDSAPPVADGRRCTIVADLDERWFTEGDTVDFRVDCVGELPIEDADITLVSRPDGGDWDPEARRFRWETDLDDGGRWDLVFQVRPRGSTDFPQAEVVTFWVADAIDEWGNEDPDPLRYTEEWGLPVLHVDPRGSLSQEYVEADIAFMGRAYRGEIKIRGAASAGYPKNSFTLDFDYEELEIEGWDTTRDHLVLVTPFDDNSYVRQKLIYDQWAAIADFWGVQRLTPRSFFVVLYLNGEYHGLYTALDHVDNEFVRHMGFSDEGNLYKSVNHDANFYLTDANGNTKSALYAGYEKKEGEPEDDYSDLGDLVAFTGNADDATVLAQSGPDAWLQIDEFMDWMLLVTYSSSGDSAGKNAYLYHDPGGTGFRYTPWDFNHAWGQNWYTARIPADSYDLFTSRNRVFLGIERSAMDTLWGRFNAMRAPGGPFDPAWLRETVDGYYAQIERSAARDWDRWDDDYYRYSRWASTRNGADDWTDYPGEKAYLYAWLDDRAALYDGLAPAR